MPQPITFTLRPTKGFPLLTARVAPNAPITATRLWLPSDLGSKLQTWLKGDDLTGSNGSSITTWTDATANANNATGATNKPTLVTAGLNGLNTVAFASASTQYFTLPTGLLTGRTQSASFAVYKVNNSPPSATNSGGPVFGDWGTDALGNHDPFTDNNFYEDYLTNSRRTVTVTGSTSFRLFGLRSKANDWRLDINAVNQSTDTTNTVGTGSAPLIGFTAEGTRYLDGQIAEIVDCNDFLTTSEKEQVEGYLAWKWGLQANLPVGHTYIAAAPTIASTATTVTITVATMTYSGQAITVNAQKDVAVTSGTMTYSGQAIKVNKSIPVTFGSMVYSAQAVAVKATRAVVAAVMSYSGQSIAVIQTSVHAISNSTMAYLGRDTVVNAVFASVTWLGNQLGLREKD